MSKRFGRNQKRKLRLKNHSLSVQLNVLHELVKSQKETIATHRKALEDWDENIRKYLGPHSSLLMQIPEKYMTNCGIGAVMAAHDGNRARSSIESMYKFILSVENLRPSHLELLISFIEIDRKSLRSYYRISEAEFKQFGFNSRFIKPLSEEIARALLKELNNSRS